MKKCASLVGMLCLFVPWWGQEQAGLDAAERQRVLDAVARNMSEHYFDKTVAGLAAGVLEDRARRGEFDRVRDGQGFAILLTKQLRETSHDMHLEVVYSADALPQPREPSAEDRKRYREMLVTMHCGFAKTELLANGVGYVRIDAFADTEFCAADAAKAMAAVNDAGAVIFDVRRNRGGAGEMVMLLTAYLFDHPEFMFDPRVSPTEALWTKSPIEVSRLADKPVYILTSHETASAAEQFSYGLKMLKRATLVGERTQGSAHAGRFFRIDDHFGMGVPEARAVNPYGATDWEGVGVEPDVKVEPDAALETAQKLAAMSIRKAQK